MNLKKQGFVLVETLIVSVFMMTLLSLLYANIAPIVAEYNRRKNYDDVTTKYVAHWARKMILDKGQAEVYTFTNGYLDVTDCDYYRDVNFCNQFKTVNHIQKIYLADYDLKAFKDYVQTSDRFSRGLIDYLNTLPEYETQAGVYRVIVETRDIHISEESNFGTIEVRR